MKKIISVIPLFSMFLMVTPFAIQAQDMARVTVNIINLQELSIDACEYMDFFATIKIGGAEKKFSFAGDRPHRRLDWSFSTNTVQQQATVSIEVWDKDGPFCGDADDRVCVEGTSNVITKTLNCMQIFNQEFKSEGTCHRSGTEKAAIKYSIIIEPTRTAYLIQGIWKEIKYETKRGTDEWAETEHQLPGTDFPNCRVDDFLIFRKNATYVRYEGATRCHDFDPASTPGTWSFQNNDSKLQLNTTGSSYAIIYTVHWIDETKMILSASNSFGGRTVYERYTFGH